MGVRTIAGRVKRRLRPPVTDAIPKSLIARHLPDDPIVIEAGAHRGTDTIELALTWPEGVIHAFEPIPALFDGLAALTRECANVRCHQLALARTSGTADMWVSGGLIDQASSLRAPKSIRMELPEITFDEMISVGTVSLDDWAAEQRVERVDALWLDLQGAELDALRGGEHLIETVTVICTEVLVTEQYEGAALYSQLRGWLHSRGFVARFENLPWNGAGNVMFVRT